MNSFALKNPSSQKSRFTIGFLRALKRINKNRPISSSPTEIRKRCRRVKIAAYASMASAVGGRRAWSRALLWKIRNQTQHRSIRKRGLGKKKRGEEEEGFGRANMLRKLVPGGEAMDLSSLLDDTAHYIKCLTTVVQVMKSVANLYST